METIKVKWDERTIFKNNDNNYTVALYKDIDKSKNIVCTGISLPETKGVTFTFEGEYKKTARGVQFQVTTFTMDLQQDEDGVIDFLCSGLIKGVGKVSAKRIYEAFGDRTFSVLRTSPEELSKVKGISGTKLAKIIASLKDVFANFDLYEFLRSHNCPWATPGIVAKIIAAVQKRNEGRAEEEKKNSIQLVSENPYWLTSIRGVDFFGADLLAKSLDFPMDSEDRFRAASNHVLMQEELSGHCAMDLQKFGYALLNIMKAPGITPAKINEGVCSLISLKYPPLKYKALRTDAGDFKYIYRTYTYEAEREVYENIIRFSKNPPKPININFEMILSDIEKSQDVTLSDSQKEAVRTALENPISIITGCPGTGKTTVLKAIAEYYARTHKDAKILMLAPTGRAARRMKESTGYEASTIHKRLKLLGEANEFVAENNLEFINEDLMIVDEVSMLDIFVAKHLLSNTSLNTKIVFVGDVDQLPSVSAGSFLRDIVKSGVVPCVTLDTVFRQSIGSILTNARKIHAGDTELVTDEYFEIHDSVHDEALEDAMLAAYLDAVKKYGIHDVVCLCPVKDYAAGVNAMNKKIQAVVNPAARDKAEIAYCGTTYRVGDLVMELKNTDYAMNGDIGTVVSVFEENEEGKKEKYVKVQFDDKYVDYEKSSLDELALAYAMTVHKAQGSEYACVITCLQDINKKMQARNLVYTAITRAKTDVKFFGSRTALANAIRHDVSDERRTLLGHYLKLASGKVWEYRNAN